MVVGIEVNILAFLSMNGDLNILVAGRLEVTVDPDTVGGRGVQPLSDGSDNRVEFNFGSGEFMESFSFSIVLDDDRSSESLGRFNLGRLNNDRFTSSGENGSVVSARSKSDGDAGISREDLSGAGDDEAINTTKTSNNRSDGDGDVVLCDTRALVETIEGNDVINSRANLTTNSDDDVGAARARGSDAGEAVEQDITNDFTVVTVNGDSGGTNSGIEALTVDGDDDTTSFRTSSRRRDSFDDGDRGDFSSRDGTTVGGDINFNLASTSGNTEVNGTF